MPCRSSRDGNTRTERLDTADRGVDEFHRCHVTALHEPGLRGRIEARELVHHD
jgi:hypothetical protein